MKRTKIALLLLILLCSCRSDQESGFSASVIAEGTAVRVPAQLGGVLLQVRVEEGDAVATGDTLAVVDAEKVALQLQQLRANEDELAAQRSIAQTNVKQALDESAFAETQLDRFSQLYSASAAPEQSRDNWKINYDRAAAALTSAKLNLSTLESKRKALAAQIELVERQLRDAVTVAPISGTVTTKYFETGEMVPPGAPVVELIDLSRMWAKVYVSETMLAAIKIGQRATVELDGAGQSLTGALSWVSPKAEFTPKNILTQESRTSLVYAVKITIDNPDGRLKHGMPVTVKF